MAIRIETAIRTMIARKILKNLKEEKISVVKDFIITKMQSHFRRKKSARAFSNLRKEKLLISLQTHLRRVHARINFKKMRDCMSKVKRIQKFYKKRFKYRTLKAITIQKIGRSLLVKLTSL